MHILGIQHNADKVDVTKNMFMTTIILINIMRLIEMALSQVAVKKWRIILKN